ncbi:MAG TPA: protein-glutamate O-methyltransferase CheR [Candidatus Binatia bacterium]|nr:protein-glutamate O-methyltransferase CheR [Candidatus Sulfotelmatobacter sp.]HXJ85964.1 protein-glutamate O-methyltransferase CheR [Candidatus Binatia bacterium]
METAVTKIVTQVEDLKDPAYLKIRDLIYEISGIYQPQEKLYLLASRCARRMAAVNAATPADYLAHLTLRANRETELRSLLNEITIGETYMFRSPAQLDALRNVILPQFVASKAAMGFKRLRLWSAGCSTGEEPYTLAMFLLEESTKLLSGWTFDILATDLNDHSLAAAKAGIYGEYSLRGTSDALRKKYFKPHDEKRLQASDQLKSLIRFERVNLSDDSKMIFIKGLDLIFCCNVLIYFDLNSKRRVMQHFYSNLLSGGYLFLGHAESLFQVDDRFRLMHFPGAIGYWKASANCVGSDKS